jgi:hypothetical protein
MECSLNLNLVGMKIKKLPKIKLNFSTQEVHQTTFNGSKQQPSQTQIAVLVTLLVMLTLFSITPSVHSDKLDKARLMKKTNKFSV